MKFSRRGTLKMAAAASTLAAAGSFLAGPKPHAKSNSISCAGKVTIWTRFSIPSAR